jgi:anti-sigma factor RsiW
MSSNSCGHDIEWWLHKKADGRLSPEEAAALERQVGTCSACQERAELLEWAGSALRQGRRAVPVAFSDTVLRRVAELRLPRRARERPATGLRWLPAAVTALAAGLVVLAVLRVPKQPLPEPPRVPVELQLAGAKARTVAVVGDFNGWDAATMKKGEDGVWRISLSLPPGRYQYAFVIDKETWVPDPQAATLVDSGYGGADSVLDISL